MSMKPFHSVAVPKLSQIVVAAFPLVCDCVCVLLFCGLNQWLNVYRHGWLRAFVYYYLFFSSFVSFSTHAGINEARKTCAAISKNASTLIVLYIIAKLLGLLLLQF